MEDVRMVVQEEGRAARNLIAFHVDLAAPSAGKTMSRKPPSSPRLLNETRLPKRSTLVTKTGSRVRSASTGRDKKSEMQARYWALLFDNLKRAVDEIYEKCERDESVSECKEVIFYLENYKRDFEKLSEWILLYSDYENTPPPQRPTSLAWEVRKSSPSKPKSQSQIDHILQNDKSPVRKHLDFFSDVKLSSAEECFKKDFTLENELYNKYGLSFGDLEEHLQTVTEVSNLNQNTVKLPGRVEENDKENIPLMSNGDESCKPVEIALSNQSSQTEESLHNSNILLRSVARKAPPPAKTVAASAGKNLTLSPLSINKTVTGPLKKTTPISPTTTIPPRAVPGSNMAAVTFVPSKRLGPTCQAKVNSNLNRSTNNLSKTNIPQQSDNMLNSNKLTDQVKVASNNLSTDKNVINAQSSSNNVADSQSLINVNDSLNKVDSVKVASKSCGTENPLVNGTKTAQTGPERIGPGGGVSVTLTIKEGETKNDVKLTQCDSQLKDTRVLSSNSKTLDSKDTKTVEKSASKELPISKVIDNQKVTSCNKPAKPMKVEQASQTDLSHLADMAAAKQLAKASTLVRNKTAPNIIRRPNESPALNDPVTDPSKPAKNIAVNLLRPAVKKPTSATDAIGEKTTLEKQTLENGSKPACALKKQAITPGAKVEKPVTEKQTVEKLEDESVLEKVIITNDDFPPLKSRAQIDSEKILKEKKLCEKALSEKIENNRATSNKPAFANGNLEKKGIGKLTSEKSTSTRPVFECIPKEKPASEKLSDVKSDKDTNTKLINVSKVYRSNTAIELRPRPARNRTVTSAGKPLINEKQMAGKKAVESRVPTKPSSDKTSNLKPTSSRTPAAPKIYRSSTSIELRPRVSFNRNVASATVKSDNRVNQMSKVNGPNSVERNPSLLKKAKAMFKSEQNLQKKSSIDEDGWETVKCRSRWKLPQSPGNLKAQPPNSRFHLPSPATSLPSIALATDPKPAKLHKEQQNQEIAKANRLALKKQVQSTPKQNVKNEKSDSLSGKKKGKEDEVEIKPVTSGRKKVSIDRVKDVMKMLNGEKLDGNCKIDKLIDILSSEDERMNEEEIRKSRELDEKEKKLNQEIQDLEDAEIEVDTETDDAETDGEMNTGNEEDVTNCRINAIKASYEEFIKGKDLSWLDQMDTMDKIEKLSDSSTKDIPYDERISTLEQLEELVGRHPGRALELHQKLSSPSRRRHTPDTIQRHRERQESAQLKREQLLQDKSNKIRELLNKVEEVQKQQAQLKEDRRKRIAEKLKKAEENRALHIRNIQRKAHDEEEKLKEIAFINNLEAQNKRHDFIASCQEKEGRLQGIHDVRQRKQEEKAAKEAAVEERRRLLEAERQEKIEKMQEKRRKREERIGREQQEKEKERQELAREKARDHQERRQALQATQQANTEELQKKIQQKQVDSARRHEENIEHIRQRALECGALRAGADDEAPPHTPYDTCKLCTRCNVLMESEVYLLSHLRGKAHQEAVKDLKDDSEPVIIDAPPDKMDAKLAQHRERQKSLRKRCKKIRSRMAQRGEEYLSSLSSEGPKKLESPNKMRLSKCLRNVDKLHSSQGQGQWPDNSITLLERNLAETVRMLEKQIEQDQIVFKELNGFTTLSNILNLALDIPKNMSPYLPPKCFLTTCTVYSLACINHPENSRFVIFSNKIALVLDLLLNRLNALITDDYKTANKSSSNLPVDLVAGALMKLFADVLYNSQLDVPVDVPDMGPRLQDIISYTVSVGVVDKLALYCSSVRDSVEDNMPASQFLHSAIRLLTMLAQAKCPLVKGDPTQLVATLRVTELVGGVSMMYGMLLHQGAPLSSPPALSQKTVWLTQATLHLLKAVAQLDLNMFQSVLGAEGISLQLRHIASYLLWYCCHPRAEDNVSQEDWLDSTRELLHQVIEVVGYFAVNHYDNQMMLQSGHMPTVMQQLCSLPFSYYTDPSLSCHLLPTLLACCHGNLENKAILEQELSYQLVEDCRHSEATKANPLVQLVK
ncbi:S phase cyclin A-associated protein in the endoplasmic reticulum [Macrosteles quadrilineatus]|uniref:S phase cyclin A-associated protein in the endoplasmic reticulum n=1 Tax=Macrosteles quadrilineatus TaxID=74068 RepID=UPI0023E0DF34|nr:S phase cyclin A-associated protein in the endoplasmic reticulum [Macrosteles quadrilineatus]